MSYFSKKDFARARILTRLLKIISESMQLYIDMESWNNANPQHPPQDTADLVRTVAVAEKCLLLVVAGRNYDGEQAELQQLMRTHVKQVAKNDA